MEGDEDENVFIKPKETDYICNGRTHDFTIYDRRSSIHRCICLIVFHILIHLFLQN